MLIMLQQLVAISSNTDSGDEPASKWLTRMCRLTYPDGFFGAAKQHRTALGIADLRT